MGEQLVPIVLAVDQNHPMKTSIAWVPPFAHPYSPEFIDVSKAIINSLQTAYKDVVDSVYGLRTWFVMGRTITAVL